MSQNNTEPNQSSLFDASALVATKKVKKNKDGKRSLYKVLINGFFVIMCAIVAVPFVAGLFASFRPGQMLIRNGLNLQLDFKNWSFTNYGYLFDGSTGYLDWYKNSIVITVISVLLTLIICYFVAYGFAMYNFKFKNFLFFLVIATMMVPFEILMLPLYKEMISLGLIDTFAGVILPGLVGASTIFFFRQFLSGLPKELLDAGRIDGSSEYGICVKIIMPMSKPAFSAMAILSAMGSWNSMLWPLIVLRSADKFTLPIGLNTLMTPYGNNYDVMVAGSMFSILPLFILYLIFNKYFVEGMTAGAVKG
ncbi:carbohydrate ABC transporter permease [Caldibacillus lycopersici]|uniref:Carbohydrate ABC transporter permease n=1 Tax=Perspicuibacillus lycopersici TaxID=1325689 RepID=A0AAE3IXD1_9BACI|nr:carbohydrate ABC transporter permease [Perspicuibacillus lycopersici]MCU9615124.1 carbohydrate ABC transporter permease [Perspicuibacillus lycopersici]